MITICHALLGEHGLFYRHFEYLENLVKTETDVEKLKAAAGPIVSALISHAVLENETILPELDEAMGPSCPTSVMRSDHEEIEAGFNHLLESKTIEEFKTVFSETLALTRDHFMREEQALFVISQEALTPQILHSLGQRWADSRHVTVR